MARRSQEITAREQQLVKDGLAILCTEQACPAGTLRPHIQPFMNYTPLNFFGIIFCMMVGTASLPHILMRYFTTPSVKEARDSVAWSLLFIFLLYFSAPAYAAFSKLEVYTNIIGRDLTQIRPWLFNWGELGLIQICGKNAASLDAVIAACKSIAGHPGVLRFQDFVINTDVIVLSTPEIAGLPYVISGLVAAGGLAAALSTADGLLLAIANALSHDIYYKMIQPLPEQRRHIVQGAVVAAILLVVMWFLDQPFWYGIALRWWVLLAIAVPAGVVALFWGKATEVGKRLIIARVLLFYVALCSAALAATRPSDILAMVGWAFSLAMAGNFPALTLGIWWKRATTPGAIAGIIAGWGICLFYLITTRYFPQAGVNLFRHDVAAEPGDGPSFDQCRAGHGRSEMACRRTRERGEPAGQQSRLVRPQQHQLRSVGDAARLPGDLRGQPPHQGTVGGDAGFHRRYPQAARPNGARRKGLVDLPPGKWRGPSGPRFFLGPCSPDKAC